MFKFTESRMIKIGEYYKSNDGLRFYVDSTLSGMKNKANPSLRFYIVVFENSKYIRVASGKDIVSGDVTPLYAYGGHMKASTIVEFKEYYNMPKLKSVWLGMMNRCYSGKNKSYAAVTVCEEWHNFITFAKWYIENNIDGWCLDKDLFSSSDKRYSPSTCCFIPRIINSSIRADIAINRDENGFYFFDASINYPKVKICGDSKEDAYRLCVINRQTKINTLVSVYWRQMKSDVINKLIHLYDNEKGQIFKGARNIER